MYWVILVAGLLSWQDATPVMPPVEVIPKAVSRVKFPVVPVVSEDPKPMAPADPDALFVLVPGRLYVVQSDEPFTLIASSGQQTLVTVKSVSGPRDFYGVFADGTGLDEERSYEAKYLAVVKAGPMPGVVELISVPHEVKQESDITRVLIAIGVAPQPPPKPKPDEPKPDEPKPDEPAGLKASLVAVTAKYVNLPAADRPKLAAAFRDAADQIQAGKITTMQQLTKVTADAIVVKMGLDAFLPWVAWRDDITKTLKTQNLNTPQENLSAWKLIADVLENK